MGLTLFDNCRASCRIPKIEGYLRSGKTYIVVAGGAHWAAPTACSPFCAIAGIAWNNFNSPLPHLSSRYYRFGPSACFSSHDIYHQSKHRNIIELIKNNRLSSRIAQTMRDLTKGN